MKKIAAAFLFIAFIAISLYAAGTRIVTEPDGTKVEIPLEPSRIACLWHPAYDKIIMMSRGSRIALIPATTTRWAKKFYPELANIATFTMGTAPDPERLIKLGIDLVIIPKGRYNLPEMEKGKIAMFCPFDQSYVPPNIDAYIADQQKQVRVFAELLGGDAKVKAEKYCAYLLNITNRVRAVVSKIQEKNKPRVYYGKNENILGTQGGNTIMHWYTEAAGGVYLPKNFKVYFAETSREQLIGWDPDIIMIGMMSTKRNNLRGLETMKAVKAGSVHNVPSGIFYWDMTSCETALLPLYLAKIFHPKLFADWDMVKEMQKFYSEIYGINISAKDAGLILKSLPPE
ncbi:MAG: ABC transporter substrate-binding protein [Spirochaetia bacterium]|jgi:iron complex transport system substrate-binding protein|nr:ABC transporter substrate-binding protein [Spirochaetia bacterium]